MLRFDLFSLHSSDDILISIDDLTFKSGEMVCIVGDNCSGKSLFLKAIYNNYKHYSGGIFLNETPIESVNSIVIVERQNYFLEKKTVMANILLPFKKVKKDDKKRAEELALMADLSDKLKTNVTKISYAEQKKTEIIRAVLQYPHLILIDDFESYFDKNNFLKIMEVLQFSADTGTLIIATSTCSMAQFKNYRINNSQLELINEG